VHNCQESNPPPPVSTADVSKTSTLKLDTAFNAYWYAGAAEISSFSVKQYRYGELRQAEQVNIFVTEDFSRQKHVKLDDPASAGDDRVPILKLNWIRKFHTGIYDYSIMQSVFKPVNGNPVLKATVSIQDWCGHVFQQYDQTREGYKLSSRSYFESEGDQESNFPACLLEDELWLLIRLNPEAIPTGDVNIIPSSLHHRFKHVKESVQKAAIQVIKEPSRSILKLQYKDIPRSLDIYFDPAFPYSITGWEESFQGALVSSGLRKKVWRGAYWNENGTASEPLRKTLDLNFYSGK
jgi:hypothetical protein